MDLVLPQVITDFYDVKEELGRSVSAIVLRVVERATGEEYALKVIAKDRVSKPDRLVTEVRALRKAQHRFVTSLKEVKEDEKTMYLVVELARGGELFNRLVERGRPFPELIAKKMFKNLFTAMSYLHSIDIIHRDIKPENILFTSPSDDTEIKLTDFGVVKLFEEAKPSRKALTYTYIGTECYMAPEIIQGLGYDHSVDMWGLGCVLYIVLGGIHPFDSGEDEDGSTKQLEAICEARFSFPENRFGRISPQAKNLISQLLRKNPMQRLSANEALRHPWIVM